MRKSIAGCSVLSIFKMADTRHSGERFRKDYISADSGLGHSFTILPTLRANIQMTWMKPGYQGLLYLENVMFMNVQIEQQLFDRRLSLSLSCDDINPTCRRVIDTYHIFSKLRSA